MKGHQKLPDDHHVVRYVPFSRLDTDADGKVIGLLFSAFQRKDTENGLSVTWLEYFAGDHQARIVAAAQAIRASAMTVGKKSGFAVGGVGPIKAQCLDRGHKIRVIHSPEDDNKAHAELRQYPIDDRELLERLATGVWSELKLNVDIPDGKVPAPDELVSPV